MSESLAPVARGDDSGGAPLGASAPLANRTPIVINGKFLSARPTGVHRVAASLIEHMDRMIAEDDSEAARRWSLLCPKDAEAPLTLGAIERRPVGRLTWQPWEQLELPRASKAAVLVNLCNLAPLSHRRSVTMIHDAQVFLSPQSYSAPFRTWYQFALPRIGARAARIVTVSEFSRERLVEFGVAPREKIVVVPNGVDHLQAVASDRNILLRLGVRPESYVLAAAGAQKHKNIRLLFQAFTADALAHLNLVVAGPDDAAAFAAAGDHAPPGVVFAGRVTDGELRALYENAAYLAFPSTTEGFGLPPLEAMSFGCPTVVAPCGALPEVCGEAALYAREDDPAAWAQAILAACESDKRTALRRAGQARAALYSWSNSARKLLAIVREVADAPSASQRKRRRQTAHFS
jgi:glycosyltransferase involved in cell wall biosynthesis